MQYAENFGWKESAEKHDPSRSSGGALLGAVGGEKALFKKKIF